MNMSELKQWSWAYVPKDHNRPIRKRRPPSAERAKALIREAKQKQDRWGATIGVYYFEQEVME